MKTIIIKSSDRFRRAPAHKQRGLMALLLAASAAGVGLSVAIGVLVLQQRAVNENTLSAQQSLQWADDALTGFAALHGRLPCPAAEPNGPEVCQDGAGKGWLPTATLGYSQFHRGQRIPPRLRYIVYRNNTHDRELHGNETRGFDLTHKHVPTPAPPAPPSPKKESDYMWCRSSNNSTVPKLEDRFGYSSQRGGTVKLTQFYLCGGQYATSLLNNENLYIIIYQLDNLYDYNSILDPLNVYKLSLTPKYVSVAQRNARTGKVTVDYDQKFDSVISDWSGGQPETKPAPPPITEADVPKTFMPRKASFDSLNPSKEDAYEIEPSYQLDLCDKLQRAAPQSPPGTRGDIWSVSAIPGANKHAYASVKVAGKRENVAYGIALPSPSGESAFTADNSQQAFEIPTRRLDAQPTDTVHVTSFQQLANNLGCPQLLSSIDTMASVTESATGVETAKEALKESWKKHHWKYETMIAFRSAKIATAVGGIAIKAYASAQVSAKLAAQVPKCFKYPPDPVACATMVWYSLALGQFGEALTIQTSRNLAAQIAHLGAYAYVFHTYRTTPAMVGVPGAGQVEFDTNEGCQRLSQLDESITATKTQYEKYREESDHWRNRYQAQLIHFQARFQFHPGVLHNDILPVIENYVIQKRRYDAQKELSDNARQLRVQAEEEVQSTLNTDEISQFLRDEFTDHFSDSNSDDLVKHLRDNEQEMKKKSLALARENDEEEAKKLADLEPAYLEADGAWQKLTWDDFNPFHVLTTKEHKLKFCSGGDCLSHFTVIHHDIKNMLEPWRRSWLIAENNRYDTFQEIAKLKNDRDTLKQTCAHLDAVDNDSTSKETLPWTNAVEALHKSLDILVNNKLKEKL
jgi:hypothetical protein